ncbi:unnamed protein product, partial [Ectocarpus fasciculatus]
AFASLRAAGTGLCDAIRAAPKPAAGSSGGGGGGQKRASDDVSVDLFAREAWSSASLTSSGRDGVGEVGGGAEKHNGGSKRSRVGEEEDGHPCRFPPQRESRGGSGG